MSRIFTLWLVLLPVNSYAGPAVERLLAGSQVVWVRGQEAPARLVAGQVVTVQGSGFGAGPDGDFAKLLVGNVRALERNLPMYRGAVDLLRQLFYEKPDIFDGWAKDILAWTDGEIRFRVPLTAHRGPLVIHVQPRTGALPTRVSDPLTERLRGAFTHRTEQISVLGAAETSEPIPVEIDNPAYDANLRLGEAIYWAYDYNIGLVHKLKGMNWDRALAAGHHFGAIPARAGEVPDVALRGYTFDPYPMPMPLKPVLRQPLAGGTTRPSGWVGYVSAESIHPLTQVKGRWIGFNCASCHAQRIEYEVAPGRTAAKVVPGLPNPNWTMRWNVLGGMRPVTGIEKGPDGRLEYVDKTQVVWSVPPGTGEHTLIRPSDDGSMYANDYLFSPIAIPVITRHTPLRRALSHTELIAGFEGSYVHSEEPDGAIGAMHAGALQALTTYMDSLDANDNWLTELGIYRWLKRNGLTTARESEFLSRGYASYSELAPRIERGRLAFERDCARCHAANFGTHTDENMLALAEVGTYFSPTEYHRQHQAIRTAILRNLFWVEPRGLLHDGHVKSLEDLVDPDRCNEGSSLYRRYYTLHSGTFRIPKGTRAQERALRRFAHFTDVNWDRENLYWDYQEMRRQSGYPAAPHPWCAQRADDVKDLVLYLLTLR